MAEKTLILACFLPYRLSVVTNLVSDVIATAYQETFGLSISEWRVVAVLAERSELNQQAISAATRMDKLLVSRAAASLADRRMLDRRVDPNDRRAQLLRLTKEGRTLYAQVAPKALALEERIFADFEPEEIEALENVLARIERAALATES